ncbi:monovalent cation/H(+) antiporter subunit G [Rhodoligotrophos ferricapiens]|uniref:monovalent cation/H(+) antiporter subunit G n=1 Tax=Rhodoligotrophos ferricapiens TaxID=3069264 RepID=UPI00315D0606
MTTASELPAWAAIITAFLLLVGSGLTLIGCIGLLRLGSFYERVHAPTIGTSMGMTFILIASMVYFTAAEGRLVIHEVLIGFFVTVTTPVTLMLLVRAARYRESAEGKAVVTSIGSAQDRLDGPSPQIGTGNE